MKLITLLSTTLLLPLTITLASESELPGEQNVKDHPTPSPTAWPTFKPTPSPSRWPTSSPRNNPTPSPTKEPTSSPTKLSTPIPTPGKGQSSPTRESSSSPSIESSSSPSIVSSSSPSRRSSSSPSKAKSSPPSAGPVILMDDSCKLSSDGEYGTTTGLGNTFPLEFFYEMKYETGYGNQLDRILTDIEEGLTTEVIKVSNPNCSTAQRRHFIRRLQSVTVGRIDGIAGLSSKPADTIMDDVPCSYFPRERCVIVKAGFQVTREKQADNNTNDNNIVDIAPLTDDELKVNLEELAKQQINSRSFHTSISGVESLYYQNSDTMYELSGGIEVDNIERSSDFLLYASMMAFVAGLVGMVGIGTLMKRSRSEKSRGHHHLTGQDERDMSIADFPITNVDSMSDEDLNSSYWSRGWENVTKSYDHAIEVCMEKKRSFRNEL